MGEARRGKRRGGEGEEDRIGIEGLESVSSLQSYHNHLTRGSRDDHMVCNHGEFHGPWGLLA